MSEARLFSFSLKGRRIVPGCVMNWLLRLETSSGMTATQFERHVSDQQMLLSLGRELMWPNLHVYVCVRACVGFSPIAQ